MRQLRPRRRTSRWLPKQPDTNTVHGDHPLGGLFSCCNRYSLTGQPVARRRNSSPTVASMQLVKFLVPVMLTLGIQYGYASDTPAANASFSLQQAQTLLTQGSPERALTLLQEVIYNIERAMPAENKHPCSSRTKTESLACLLDAAAKNQSAFELGPNYVSAYYLKGYAHVELGQLALAQQALERALTIAPNNAMVLAELGQLRLQAKDWQGALVLFERAVESSELAPDPLKLRERSRAWRGAGYALVELNRLADARALFEKCLQADPTDGRAKHELRYLDQLERRQGDSPSTNSEPRK